MFSPPEIPHFTKWVMENGYLREPFRLLDVGVQGGNHTRFNWFGDRLEVFGFDPLKLAIDELNAKNPDPKRFHYFHIGLGNEDGERLFQEGSHPYGSAFLPPHMANDAIGRTPSGELPDKWESIQIRRIDTLVSQNVIPVPDFIKLDCEGFEIEIIKGASALLADVGLFGIESESNLMLHPHHSPCHFVDLYRAIGPHGFDVADIYYYRQPLVPINTPHDVGPPNTFDFMFMRGIKSTAPVDRVIKMMMVAELYFLQDIALLVMSHNRDALAQRLDLVLAEQHLRSS